jgi:translocation protein SEC63
MGAIYDNSAFYYFFGVMLQFYLLPATCYNVTQFYQFLSARASAGSDLGKGRTVAERKKFLRIQEKRRQCKNLFTPCFAVQLVILVLLWALFAFIMTLAAGDSEIMTFDPYRILGVEQGSETRAIKRAYRKQSLIYHPDKNPGNKKAEETFMMIAKAYEALTDPEAKENWEKYGNPDGKQPMEMGIGLPSWVMEPENRNIVMIMYLFGLVVCIPAAVWKYYSWSRKYMDAVLTETYSVFGDRTLFAENAATKHIPEILCMAAEFRDMAETFTKDKSIAHALAKLESQLRRDGMLPKIRKIHSGNIIKFFNHFLGNKAAFILLHAHLHRVTIDDKLTKLSEDVLQKMPRLVDAMVQIGQEKCRVAGSNQRTMAQAPMWLMSVKNVLAFSQGMTQAVWYPPVTSSKKKFAVTSGLQSSLLQLPYFSPTEVNHYSKNAKKSKAKSSGEGREGDLRAYLRSSEIERDGESFKRGQKDFTDAEKADVLAVQALIPDLDLQVEAGVDGEDRIVEDDFITVDLRLIRHGAPPVSGDDDAEESQPVHSEFWPFAKKEKWWCFLLYHVPQPPGQKKSSEQRQRLLLSSMLTAADRLKSEPIYAKIDELMAELPAAREEAQKKDDELEAEYQAKRKAIIEQRKAAGDFDEDEDDENEFQSYDDELEFEERIFSRSRASEIEDEVAKLRKKLPTRFRFKGPEKEGTYTFTVVIKSDSYLGLDLRETFDVKIETKDLLEKFVPHPEDLALDNEPTMFDLMHNQLEEMNNDFDSSDDEEDDESVSEGGEKKEPKKKEPEKKEPEKKGDEGYVLVDKKNV